MRRVYQSVANFVQQQFDRLTCMTQLIDYWANPNQSLIHLSSPQKDYQSAFQSHPKQSLEEEQSQQKLVLCVHKEFVPNFDACIGVQVGPKFQKITVNLLDKAGSMLKIGTSLDRSFVSKQILREQFHYTPVVNPLSGLVAFQACVFIHPRTISKSCQNLKESAAWNIFDFERLRQDILRLLKICIDSEKEHFYDFQSKNSCQIAKTVDFLSDKSEMRIQQLLNIHSAKNGQFRKQLQGLLVEGKIDTGNILWQTTALKRHFIELNQESISITKALTRKSRNNNFHNLVLGKGQEDELNKALFSVSQSNIGSKILKLTDNILGPITVQLQKEEPRQYKLKTGLLRSLKKETEFVFLDKYFRNNLHVPVSIRLALKDVQLPAFLEQNRLSMSYETKLRILTQICCAVHTAWETSNVLLSSSNMRSLFVTRHLSIKFRDIDSYFLAQDFMLLEDKEMVNQAIRKSLLQLGDIFFKSFYQRSLFYIRPFTSKRKEEQLKDANFRASLIQKRPLDSISNYVKSSLNRSILGLAYVFYSNNDRSKTPNQNVQSCMKLGSPSEEGQQLESADFEKKETSELISNRYICAWMLLLLQREANA